MHLRPTVGTFLSPDPYRLAGPPGALNVACRITGAVWGHPSTFGRSHPDAQPDLARAPVRCTDRARRVDGRATGGGRPPVADGGRRA